MHREHVLVEDIQDDVLEAPRRVNDDREGRQDGQHQCRPPWQHDPLFWEGKVEERHDRQQEGEEEGVGDQAGRAGREEEDNEVELMQERKGALPDEAHASFVQLHRAEDPPVLLLAVGGVLARQLIGRAHIMQPQSMPPDQVRAQRQVHVLDERLVIPAARRVHARLTPDASRAVELQEGAARRSSKLLPLDMLVERDLHPARERRLVLVEVGPAPLHEPKLGVVEQVGHRAQQKVGERDEVTVKDGNVLCRDQVVEGEHVARLEALAIRAPAQSDVDSPSQPKGDSLVNLVLRDLVRGVIAHEDLEAF